MILGFSIISVVFQFVISTYLFSTSSKLEKLSQSILEKEQCKICNKEKPRIYPEDLSSTQKFTTQSSCSHMKCTLPVLIGGKVKDYTKSPVTKANPQNEGARNDWSESLASVQTKQTELLTRAGHTITESQTGLGWRRP